MYGRGDTGGFDRDAAIARRATAAEQAANSQQVVADPNQSLKNTAQDAAFKEQAQQFGEPKYTKPKIDVLNDGSSKERLKNILTHEILATLTPVCTPFATGIKDKASKLVPKASISKRLLP